MTRESVVAAFERRIAAQTAVKHGTTVNVEQARRIPGEASPARLDIHEGAESAVSRAGHYHG